MLVLLLTRKEFMTTVWIIQSQFSQWMMSQCILNIHSLVHLELIQNFKCIIQELDLHKVLRSSSKLLYFQVYRRQKILLCIKQFLILMYVICRYNVTELYRKFWSSSWQLWCQSNRRQYSYELHQCRRELRQWTTYKSDLYP